MFFHGCGSLAGCKGRATAIFLRAVSVAGCKGAASAIFLTAVSTVSVAGCKGAALTAVSMAGCERSWQRFLHIAHVWSIFEQFVVHIGLPGVPGMAFGTLGDHLCDGTPEKVDFSCLWGPCWELELASGCRGAFNGLRPLPPAPWLRVCLTIGKKYCSVSE